ncbi:MAG: hypothetical protein JWR61_5135 [Ferruginibacter sp.]|uniref:outer membrane beta-barrel protein n=1 Tax=Ferruginibacter sp. TaxID=1940288 RepID=UPI0026582C0D|nr:outer membrane beta-barrel protein [Ferruginibacter sp.]MDB5280180.1 hypothetical protein [Ferruginibacter sp.]
MPENEFEKEVQQKIVGLKLKPNDEVWQNVAGAINKRKGKSRIFAFILLLLFFSTAGLYIVYKNTKQNEKSAIAVHENVSGKSDTIQSSVKKEEAHLKPVDASNDNVPAVKEKIGDDELFSQKKEEEQTTSLNQPALSKLQPAGASIAQKKVGELTTSLKQLILSNEQPAAKKIITQNKKETIIRNQFGIADVPQNGSGKIQYKKKQKLKTKISNGFVEVDRSETTTLAGKENKNVEDDVITSPADSGLKHVTALTVISSPDKNISSEKDTIASLKTSPEKANAVAKKSIHIKQTSKWKLGVNFSAGISATNNQYLGIIGSSNSDANKAYYSADQISTPGNNSQAGTPVYRPSKISSGAGIIAGIFVQKNISPAAILSIGLNYKMYNTTMTVGSQLDSIVPANNYLNLSSAAYRFYRTGASSNYKNHFHFIELPVAVKIALNKKHKRAAYLTTGIAIARLISSNALQFDTASGKYYSNNNLLKKTQANVSVGALFSMSRMTKNPLLIGPEINFSLNKIARENLYGGRHYSYFGLRLQKNFGKK